MFLESAAGRIVVPAGDYYIGDPCYFFTHDDWGGVVSGLLDGQQSECPNGLPVIGFGTKWGDGAYRGSDGFTYGVDAGMIGLVSVDGVTSADIGASCRRVTFDEPQECWGDDGVLHFGPVTIDTKDEDDEDDECPHCGRPY